MNVYGGMNISFAELIQKVRPCGKVGEYLCNTMFAVNDWYGKAAPKVAFPHGEMWSIGDQPTVAAMLESSAGKQWHVQKAPGIHDDMSYAENLNGKDIMVFDGIDRRFLMDDFFAKLALCFG